MGESAHQRPPPRLQVSRVPQCFPGQVQPSQACWNNQGCLLCSLGPLRLCLAQVLSTETLHRLLYVPPSSTSPGRPMLFPQFPRVDHVLCMSKKALAFGKYSLKHLEVKRHHICKLL